MLTKSQFRFILFWLLTALYIGLILSLVQINISEVQNFNLIFTTLDANSLSGIIAQLQVLLMVLFVILFAKSGLQTTLCLCGFSIFSNLSLVLIKGHIASLTGLTMYLSGVVVALIIYYYGSSLTTQIRKTQKQKEKLNEMAFYDALTGLPNRRYIQDLLEERTQNPATAPFTFLLIDLDDFKKVNDFFGHPEGDDLLRSVAITWQPLLHSNDILGRLGGDEFALILDRQISLETAKAHVQKFYEAIRQCNSKDHQPFMISASIGMARYPEDGTDMHHLFKCADIAMYHAKQSGKNTIMSYNQKMHERFIRRIRIEEALSQALEHEELHLVYQPQFQSHTKKLRGFEALLRWQSKTLGAVSPADFIPVAEERSLIVPIGYWVIKKACQDFLLLQAEYAAPLILSINISTVQLLETNFVSTVKSILDETQFSPSSLEFEITESVFITSKRHVVHILEELKAFGIRIALDDFGTAYASLSYIQMLPLDTLKIDRSFIKDLLDINKSKEQELVYFIISMAQHLNFQVVAEGIEHLVQLEYLKEKGCDFIQGYLWGKPLPLEQLQPFLLSSEEHIISSDYVS